MRWPCNTCPDESAGCNECGGCPMTDDGCVLCDDVPPPCTCELRAFSKCFDFGSMTLSEYFELAAEHGIEWGRWKRAGGASYWASSGNPDELGASWRDLVAGPEAMVRALYLAAERRRGE